MKTEAILKVMEETFGEVWAASFYGSQVCGYATRDSDYDVLVVFDDYGPGVKYTYVDAGAEIAFLGVSRRVLEDDARDSAYGGFIADRLINPLQPILNNAYIRSQEIERKKTIIAWETEKLVYRYKEKSVYLDINLLYYPYKKWRKIAGVYHPYKYSIENVLRSDLRGKNLKALLPGFQKAIVELGILTETYPGWYRPGEEYVKKTLSHTLKPGLERAKIVEREIEGVVARYLTHSRAGDSDRDLIIKEVLSKVKREVRQIGEKKTRSALIDPKRFLIKP